MQHVSVRMTANGRESEIHPLYGLLANAPFVERATALQYNYTDEELSMLHYVEGDADAMAAALGEIEAAFDFALERVDDDRFYAYLRGHNTGSVDSMFGPLSASGIVVVPPIVYHPDGSVTTSFFGPDEDFQPVIDRAPEPLEITIEAVGGLESTAGVDARLSDRQRTAIRSALELGYYEVPREANQADVARAMDCSPSTAAEHLQKAEASLVRSFLGT